MEEALKKMPTEYKRNTKLMVLCVETGEVFPLMRWAMRIAKHYEIDETKLVYARIHRAAKHGDGESFGLHWRMVNNQGAENV